MTIHEEAAEEVLEHEISAEDLHEATARVAAPTAANVVLEASVIVFRLGSEWFALSTSVFEEVAETRPRHTLPHRRGIVEGLVSIRGELLPCVRLATLLGVDSGPARSPSERIVVMRRDDLRVACVVAEVSEIYRYDPAEVKPLPATADNAYVNGLVPWKGRTAGRLDDEILFYGIAKGLA